MGCFVKLSRRTDYALRALFTLVDRAGQGPVTLGELASRNDIPRSFLEQIMLSLKERGWVTSSPGRRGGYSLACPPDRITMGQVIRHFDGLLAPIACVSPTHHEPCSQSPTCRFRRALLTVRNITADFMDNATLADVARLEPVADREVFTLELVAGDGI
jgi:Rrf2 family protein